MVRISVVMPTYNTAIDVLREAVDSILKQTFQDFECIFVDDCGNDRSMEILEKLIKASPNRMKYKVIQHEKNREW